MDSLGIEPRVSTKAELYVKDGRVAGVKVKNDNGTYGTIYAKAVVLATGGFASNPKTR